VDVPVRSGRGQEAFGIVALAAALFLGPSLFSVQFAQGYLMGPFGHAVGSGLNWVLGLGGYLAVLGLVSLAFRLFGHALGRRELERAAGPRWRRRIIALVVLIFCSVLLQLIFRPSRLGTASYGGALGEWTAELLCALLSTPGTWIVVVTALVLSLILSTRLSVARSLVGSAQHLWQLAQLVSRLGLRVRGRLAALSSRLREQIAHLRRSQEIAADAGGGAAAAMPPVLRVGYVRNDRDPRTSFETTCREAARPQPLPADLEIGWNDAVSAAPPDFNPPTIVGGDGGGAQKPLETVTRANSREESAWGNEDTTALGQPTTKLVATSLQGSTLPTTPVVPEFSQSLVQPSVPADTLTIIESKYDADGQLVESDHAAKQLDRICGPGFVLFGESYRPPPLSLFANHGENENNDENTIDRDAIYAQAERLAKTLADYKISGRVTKVHPGPVVTMYEFVPTPGTRIATVARLSNDLAMSLKAQRVRIVAPIPGKGAIGIEVPNEKRATVSFKEIVAHDSFAKAKAKLPLALGKNIFGAPVSMDLAKMPHLLVAGATGAGKSVSINAMICSMLLQKTPEEVRMIMIDPKFLELSGYNDIPHLLLPVVTDPKKANTALRWAVAEMERRYQLLADMKVRDISSYNRKVDRQRGRVVDGDVGLQLCNGSIEEARPSQILVVRRNPDGSEEPVSPSAQAELPLDEELSADDERLEDELRCDQVAGSGHGTLRSDRYAIRGSEPELRRLPYIVVIIDEFADLMMAAPKEVETSVARLAQKARAAGIHLIVATQRPSVDVITGLIKANFPSRIAFQVASPHDSKTILGGHGAENLLGSGDMLVLDRGTEMRRLHGAYISDEEIQAVIEHLHAQGKPIYDETILSVPDDDDDLALPEEEHDEMYDLALAIVAESRQASISMIQRRLRIGYNRAARIVERMEREGVVGPADGVRGREVLVQSHD
jgi:S-DNA-T family DNA segregation ATPase FtsK/SpoIIIE